MTAIFSILKGIVDTALRATTEASVLKSLWQKSSKPAKAKTKIIHFQTVSERHGASCEKDAFEQCIVRIRIILPLSLDRSEKFLVFSPLMDRIKLEFLSGSNDAIDASE